MKAYLVKTPKLVQRIYPKRVWAFPMKKKQVFLTFDDGPIPEVTPWVLSLLKKYDAKATFFCIGDNVSKHPEVFQQTITEGHAIGNHTFHHLNGRKTKFEEYLEDVEKADSIMLQARLPVRNEVKVGSTKLEVQVTRCSSPITQLYRPPFGKMTAKQSKALQKQGYKIIMWDVLSADFDASISEEKCLQNVIKNIEEGSIVVFHDSLKAEKKLRYALPKVLDFISEKGWKCQVIDL